MTMAAQDESFLTEIKKAGNPPSEISNLTNDQTWLSLFESFISKTMSDQGDLCEYVGAVQDLLFGNGNPKEVWLNRLANWDTKTNEAASSEDLETLKSLMLDEFELNLKEVYSNEFLTYVGDVKAGVFDTDEEEGEQELALDNSIEALINELSEVVGKSNTPVNDLLEKVRPEDFGTNKDELGAILNELSNYSDSKDKHELRKSVALDERELSKLLEELTTEDSNLPETDELLNLIDQLATFTEDKPDEEILSMLDTDQFQASDDELEKLLIEIEEFNKATDKNQAINHLRESVGVKGEDLEKLLNELSSGTAKTNWTEEWDQKLDSLLDELVQDAPGQNDRVNLLSNVATNSLRLSGDDLDKVLKNLASLSDQKDDKPLRRRVSREISSEEIDQLINELKSFDFGAQDKPAAMTVAGWDTDWVAELNYRNIKAAEGGTAPVVCVAEYVLIGEPWSDSSDETIRMYRNALTRAYEGESDYPASKGLIESGQIRIEKSSSIFNPGKIEVSGIASGNNRRGIEASIKAKSKKKVVFVD